MLDEKIKILLIGSKGMLGHDLGAYLLKKGLENVSLYDLPKCDITDSKILADCLTLTEPKIVINCSGITDVDGSEGKMKEAAYHVNSKGLKNLALLSIKFKFKLIHFSTDFVFDGLKSTPYSENDIPNPLSEYAKSKYEGEIHIKQLCNDYLIIRTSWLYGRQGKNFVNTIIQSALEKRTLNIVDDQVGSPTWTEDLCEATYKLMNLDTNGFVHYSNEGECSWFEFGEEIVKTIQDKKWKVKCTKITPIKSRELKRPALRPKYSVLSKDKFKKLTKASPQKWKESLHLYIGSLN